MICPLLHGESTITELVLEITFGLYEAGRHFEMILVYNHVT